MRWLLAGLGVLLVIAAAGAAWVAHRTRDRHPGYAPAMDVPAGAPAPLSARFAARAMVIDDDRTRVSVVVLDAVGYIIPKSGWDDAPPLALRRRGGDLWRDRLRGLRHRPLLSANQGAGVHPAKASSAAAGSRSAASGAP